ncbi:hippocalcin-like protein 4 isoform X2 [Paramacrobiotus metropolitanus]|uniref:hippocalcin-like protein 4 isoform X2 n=1 Tax=Paramacrobiotus metropolitanus TaxID=2943436 RepID=UPI002445B8DC|nr:hippocalcin-like protein 4 isoform X2 [Paramacrobiotus metropolitanus]
MANRIFDNGLTAIRTAAAFVRKAFSGSSDEIDGDFEDFDVQVIHYKPSNLDDLCQLTHYSREEIRMIYRGFKQECPAGIVDEERFRELYCQFFPLGDASPYAKFVFSTFDQDEDGHVTFDQFIIGMSLLARGTLTQKLQWVFNLYDLNGTGKVSRANMKEILMAMHLMLGSHSQPCIDEQSINTQIDQIFAKLDLDADGSITFAEFTEACQNDPQIVSVFGKFDTVISS